MSAGVTSLTGGASELIIAADDHRDFLTVQLHGTETVCLAFGEAAVDATGIILLYPGCSVRVMGCKARLPVYGWASGAVNVGTETCEDVEYRPGSFAYGY